MNLALLCINHDQQYKKHTQRIRVAGVIPACTASAAGSGNVGVAVDVSTGGIVGVINNAVSEIVVTTKKETEKYS